MYADLIPSRTIKDSKGEGLFFSGTAYLGIHARPEFKELVIEGIERYGTNYGASRLGNVSIPVLDIAESKLSAWLGAPAALLVSSGTLAGRLMLEVLANYKPHYSPNAHIAINPDYQLHQPERFDQWIDQTIDHIRDSSVEQHLITFNSVDALTATKPGLDWISRLPKNKEILLLADDSHGIGVLGDQGKGIYPELMRRHSNSIVVVSLGKAMGLPAGAIIGATPMIHRAKSHPLFGGSSPMVPAYAYAFIHADQMYEKAYEQLHINVQRFKQLIRNNGLFHFIDEFPIFCTTQYDLAHHLENHRIRISHFAYPSPKDKLYTRIIINGLHTAEDLEELAERIKGFKG